MPSLNPFEALPDEQGAAEIRGVRHDDLLLSFCEVDEDMLRFKAILCSDESRRTADDNHFLVQNLRSIKLIRQLPARVQRQVPHVLKFTELPAGENLFHEAEAAFFFNISAHADGERRGTVSTRRFLKTRLTETFLMLPCESI